MMGNLQNIRTKKMIAQGGCCYYCGLPVWDGRRASDLPERFRPLRDALLCTAEHLLARSEGGRDDEGNIVAACQHCNRTRHRSKHPKSPEAYRAHVHRRMAVGKWHCCALIGTG